MDAQDNKRDIRSWRDYLKEFADYRDVLGWVWRELICDETKRWIRRMCLLFVLDTLIVLANPWAIRYVFDGLMEHDARKVLLGLAGTLATVVIGRIVGYGVLHAREYVLGLNVGNLDKRTSELFNEKSMGQHLREHSYLSPANVEKGRSKVLVIEESLLFHGIETILHWSVAYLLLWCISWVAGLVMTAAFVIHLVWALYLSVRVNRELDEVDRELRRINRYRVERWDSVDRVKTNGKERHEVDTTKGWFDRIIAVDRAFWLSYLRHMVLRGGITSLALIGILAYGAAQVWNGVWTIGLLYPLFAWASRVRDGFGQLSDIERMINYNFPSVKSMKQALTEPSDIENGAEDARAIARPLTVDFDGLTHGYGSTNARHGVLRDVRFRVEGGEKVAIIGRSGAGKTTIMRALLRYMDPDGGRILVNGRDLRTLDLPSLLHRIGYIPQQAQILDGTLRYNLTYGLTDERRARISDEELWEIIRMLQLDVGRLTDGLDTKVGRNGVKLSGGEAQRVMIGAAALKDPDLMIVDEATSSLDAATERAVHDGLRKVLAPDMSALIITHRLSTVRDICTKFVVIRPLSECRDGEGQVEAIAGSFEELYRVSATFRELADEQGVVIDAVHHGNGAMRRLRHR